MRMCVCVIGLQFLCVLCVIVIVTQKKKKKEKRGKCVSPRGKGCQFWGLESSPQNICDP